MFMIYQHFLRVVRESSLEHMEMMMEMTSLIFICLWVTVTGSTVATTASPSDNDSKCSADVFKNCTNTFTSLVNITIDVLDTDALMQFYCSPNYTIAIDCLRDHLDPTCGPDTDAYIWNRTLAAIPSDFSYDKYCHNDTAKGMEKLLQCVAKFRNVKGYGDCIIGKTLNKTLDPTDTCNYLKTITGCSYKYTKIMCPNSTQIFIEYSRDSLKNCDVNFESSAEAIVCDKDIEKACVVAYNPPPVTSNSNELTNFICSENGRGLQSCLRTVYGMCKNNSYFNSSSVDRDIQIYEAQTATFCSDKSNAMKECHSKFSKVTAFQDCITGKTLNADIDPADTCLFIKNSVACTYKYTDLMCPEFLQVFNKSITFPSICDQNKEMGKATTSCDLDMGQACTVGFNPPDTSDTDVYLDFVCSGRAAKLTLCVQKVRKLCFSDTIDRSEQSSSEHQTKIICSDKTGFTKYMQCLRTTSFQEEYANCSDAKANTSSCIKHECQLKSLEKTCSRSAKFYQKLQYQALVACRVVEATTKGTNAQTTIISSGSYLGVSIAAFVAVYNSHIRDLV